MRILVTGGTGFIGSYILRHLLTFSQFEVVSLHRKTSKFDLVSDIKDQILWFQGDVLDIPSLNAAFQNIDVVIHAAGVVCFDNKCRNRMLATNIEGTANVVNQSILNKISRFIHISSVTALGNVRDHPLDEESTWQASPLKSSYAKSKYLGELEVWRGCAEGLNSVMVLPAYVIGAGYWNSGPNVIFDKIDNGLIYYPIGSSGIVDVRDLARMVAGLIDKVDISNCRIICSRENLFHRDLFKRIATQLGVSKSGRPLTGMLASIAILWEKARSMVSNHESLISKESYRIASSNFLYDNTKSQEALPFDYRSLDKSIQDVCKSYLTSKEKGEDFGILSI